MVGFSVVISDHLDGLKNIRSICPLIDTPDCTDTEFDLSAITDLTAYIGGGPVTQGYVTDTYNQYYGNTDGTFCVFEHRYDQLPDWAYVTGNTLIIQSLTDLDQPDSARSRVRIFYNNSNRKGRWFNLYLVCESLVCGSLSDDKIPPELTDTDPLCAVQFDGSEFENKLE